MAIDCINVELIDTPSGNNGDWWDSPFGLKSLQTAINSRGKNDIVHVGADPQRLKDVFFGKRVININNGGEFETDINKPVYLAVKFGNIGSRLETSMSQDSWWAVGSRPFPARRADSYLGENFVTITQDCVAVEGLKVKNVKSGIYTNTPLNFLKIRDVQVTNAERGIHFDDTVYNLTIDGLMIKDCGRESVFLQTNFDSVIRNVTILNNGCEDGQQAGIRALGLSNNLLIEDVIVGGTLDTWRGPNPIDPFDKSNPNNPNNYVQGDAIATEQGTNVTIRRVVGYTCCDRIIDCKADNSIAEYCSGIAAKAGITMWGDNSVIRHCSLKTSRWYGNSGSVGYMTLGENSGIENSELTILDDRVNEAFSFRRGHTNYVRNCVVNSPRGTSLVRLRPNPKTGFDEKDTTIIFENLNLNGEIKNFTLVMGPEQERFTIDDAPYRTSATEV